MKKDSTNKKEYKIVKILTIFIIVLIIILFIKINKEKINLKTIIFNKKEIEKISNINNEEIITENETKESSKYDFIEIKNNRYYYNQLNDNAKIIYNEIEKNLMNMVTGKYEIKLDSKVAEILKLLNGEEQLNINFQSAWDALSLDRVDLFFIDISKINLSIKKTKYGRNVSYVLNIIPKDEKGYLVDNFKNEEEVKKALIKTKKNRDDIIYKIKEKKEYDKILYVHDWIIENVKYSSDLKNINSYSIYGALIEKSAVCEGYAKALKYIYDELEMPCILISGKVTNSEGITENHEWNYVEIDEKWYAIDSTWDDPIMKNGGYKTNDIKHRYFLQGQSQMNKNHKSNGKITPQGQEFTYPKLEINRYKK